MKLKNKILNVILISAVSFGFGYQAKTKAIKKIKVLQGIANKSRQKRIENRISRHVDYSPTGRFFKKGETLKVKTNQKITAYIGLYGKYENFNNQKESDFQTIQIFDGSSEHRINVDGMLYINNFEIKDANVEINGGNEILTINKEQFNKQELSVKLANYQQPFIELIGDNVIATFQTKTIKTVVENNIQDFKNTLNVWDSYIDLAIKVSGLCSQKDDCGPNNPEFRYQQKIHFANPDCGDGYAYATDDYISFHKKAGIEVFKPDNSWLLLHEIGHMFQNNQYLWEGQGEVTVNMLNQYARSKLGQANRLQDQWIIDQTKAFLKLDKPKSYIKDLKSPFVKLMLFEQLRIAFGNEFLTWLNVEARNNYLSQKNPQSDFEKQQALIINSSRVTNYNLGFFFEKWGIIPSQVTLNEISNYPKLTTKIFENGLTLDPTSNHEVIKLPEYKVKKIRFENSNDLKIAKGIKKNCALDELVAKADANYQINHYDNYVSLLYKSEKTTNIIFYKQKNGTHLAFQGLGNRELFYGYLDSFEQKMKFELVSNYQVHRFFNQDYIKVEIYDKHNQLIKQASVNGKASAEKLVETLGSFKYQNNYRIKIFHKEIKGRLKAYNNDQYIKFKTNSKAPNVRIFEIINDQLIDIS